ncbi:MAG: aminotransferase class I/II-fold pyridoxal phosphate-dependent enzyme [Alphaproteobacteria bacterium]|nr:aminotransferase class I/II-fold pyridoxal phosphate-dependent enzyme [Alphaproteobacteria bacterium]
MSLKISRRSDVPAFRALDTLRLVNERIADGMDIKRLEAGQPCFGAPEKAIEHARACLRSDPRQGYTEAIGMTRLRKRIARYYGEQYGVEVDYSRIAVTFGSSGGFLLSFLSALDVGDKVAMACPGYAAYRNFLKALGITPVEFNVDETTNFQPTVAHLEALKEKVDGLIVCSPANPSGTMLTPQQLKDIARWCGDNGVRLFSDEVYHGVTYDRKAETVLKFSQNAVVLNSFSKYFAMTGWRLGWLVLPEDLTDPVKRLAENLFVSPPTLAQSVAHEVFDYRGVLDGYVDVYRANREVLLRELPKAGFTRFSNPEGAFYIYVDVNDITGDSVEFCRRMLDEAHVSATPGLDFDTGRGHATVRISYAGSTADIEEACRRLYQWRMGGIDTKQASAAE